LLTDPEVLPVLDRARSARARLFVVRDEGENGAKLDGLGAIAAILRYDWTSSGRPTRPPGSPRAALRTGA